jgi:hypothetical protein
VRRAEAGAPRFKYLCRKRVYEGRSAVLVIASAICDWKRKIQAHIGRFDQ